MTVSQYDHVVPHTDLGGRGYLGVYRRSCITVVVSALSFEHPLVVRYVNYNKPTSTVQHPAITWSIARPDHPTPELLERIAFLKMREDFRWVHPGAHTGAGHLASSWVIVPNHCLPDSFLSPLLSYNNGTVVLILSAMAQHIFPRYPLYLAIVR